MPIKDLSEKILPEGGKLFSFKHCSENIKPGTVRPVTVYVPAALKNAVEVALQVHFDGMPEAEPAIMEKLIAEGAVPPAISLGITAATYPASLVGGTDRSVRSPEYDGLGPSLADYIIEDLLPEVETLPLNVKISSSPDMHAVNGCSSGGIASWNACWERNDFFRRCFIASPTFSSFRGGDSLPFLMRKYETKKIRCYMTVGTDDMRNSAGDWYLEALTANEAMKYAGYEFEFKVFEGGVHGVGAGDPEVMEYAFRYIWKDWATKGVGVLHYGPRVADLVTPDTTWVEVAETMPEPPECPYQFSGKCVLLNGNVVARMPYPVSAIALSSDRWRLYVATTKKRYVYAYAIAPDGSLKDPYAHAHLHLKDDFDEPGAFDICIDSGDRLYAATELGIQTTCHNGENNVILPLPGNPSVVKIAFSRTETGVMYAQSGDGRVYRRAFLTCAPDGTVQPPNTISF